jgi:hypothetical protein
VVRNRLMRSFPVLPSPDASNGVMHVNNGLKSGIMQKWFEISEKSCQKINNSKLGSGC